MSDEVREPEAANEQAPEPEGAAEFAAVEGAEVGQEATPAAKKKAKKGLPVAALIAIIVGGVIVLGGGGVGIVYATQHDNPQFCNFVCHVPMDPYVASYQNNVSVGIYDTKDKRIYANEQELDVAITPLSVTVHKNSDQDIKCVTCHNEGIDSQISEGIAWITGNYDQPLNGFVLSYKTPEKIAEEAQRRADSGAEPSTVETRSGVEFCLRSGCHSVAYSEATEDAYKKALADLKEHTKELKRNPHESHNGDLDCSNCHQTHKQSVNWCTQCHADSNLPAGWINYTDQQKQLKELKAALQ